MQTWLSTNSLNSNYTKVQLHLLSGLSFAYNNSEPNNDTKLDRTLCKHCKLWTEKQDCIQWDNCCGTEGIILINGSYGIVWDWSPKGYAVSNCSHQKQFYCPHKRLCWQVHKVFNHTDITTLQIIQLDGMVVACHPFPTIRSRKRAKRDLEISFKS